MWLRTTMNYQYRYGTSTPQAIKALYKQVRSTRDMVERKYAPGWNSAPGFFFCFFLHDVPCSCLLSNLLLSRSFCISRTEFVPVFDSLPRFPTPFYPPLSLSLCASLRIPIFIFVFVSIPITNSLLFSVSPSTSQGGVFRFYRGIGPALLQGPLSRFGDTAANTGVLSLLDSYEATRSLPVAVKTVAASATAALWRVVLMPIDTTKTVMQVRWSWGGGL